MEKKLYIPIILGTGRTERYSQRVASFIFKEIKDQQRITSEIVDVRMFDQRFTARHGEEFKEWRDIADKADGFILVFPEYNHGFPGELKIFLDSQTKVYNRKPAALCGVSSGQFGGVRAVEMIKPVLTDLKMVIIPRSLYFSNVEELFDKYDNISDSSYKKKSLIFFNDLIWYANTLKYGRENFNI